MRKKRRTRRNIKTNNNYIIFIIICLLFLNVGGIAYKLITNKSNSNVNGFSIVNTITSFINLDKIKPLKRNNENTSGIIQEDPNNLNAENQNELFQSNDFIIDRLSEYESLIIIKDSYGITSIENIPKPLNIQKVKLDKANNYILMYHTHATEGYFTSEEGVYHDNDINKNVVRIGNTLTTVLEANGHMVDHVETLHDLPSYNNSYTRSLSTVNKKKEEQPNLKIFLDIHRDGVDKDAKYKDIFLEKARINIKGVSIASFSLVIGPDTPNYDKVLSFAKYIKAVSDTLYPNLCTGIIIKPRGKYNLYASDYSALIEIGSNLVTIEEANECAKLVGEILSLVIDSILE